MARSRIVREYLRIGPHVLGGELAAARGNLDLAISHLETAVRLEAALAYTEPSEWHYPPRLALRRRHNGWALFGLWQALTAQGKTQQAAEIKGRFERAWERADIELTASRFGAIATQ